MTDTASLVLGLLGLVLLTVGMALAWTPLGLIVPGAILLWVATRPSPRPRR